jgi:hypothetical protein
MYDQHYLFGFINALNEIKQSKYYKGTRPKKKVEKKRKRVWGAGRIQWKHTRSCSTIYGMATRENDQINKRANGGCQGMVCVFYGCRFMACGILTVVYMMASPWKWWFMEFSVPGPFRNHAHQYLCLCFSLSDGVLSFIYCLLYGFFEISLILKIPIVLEHLTSLSVWCWAATTTAVLACGVDDTGWLGWQ